MTKIKDKYQIERKYISFGKSRSGQKLTTGKPIFLVAHETANNSADADDHYRYFNRHPLYASAHTFIDDKKILEIIPLDEKAWHVNYDKPKDNQLFGEDANDAAIGSELCRTGDFDKAYDRYVWYHAYLCRKFGLDPRKKIVPHSVLDPQRRRDPESWLNPNGVTWEEFINDVVEYYNNWDKDNETESKPKPKLKAKYRVRKSWEDASSQIGAYANLDGAKEVARANKGYKVYEIATGKLIYDPHKKDKPKPKDDDDKPSTKTKKYIHFPRTAQSWRVYPLDKAPVKGNEKAFIKPAKFGGLTYEILGEKEPYTYVIQTSDFGKVKAYGHPSTGAIISTKKVVDDKPKTNKPQFKVGEKVKIKKSTERYATGERIPSWVKNGRFTIMQVKSDRVLLKEIMSWVYKKDVE